MVHSWTSSDGSGWEMQLSWSEDGELMSFWFSDGSLRAESLAAPPKAVKEDVDVLVFYQPGFTNVILGFMSSFFLLVFIV